MKRHSNPSTARHHAQESVIGTADLGGDFSRQISSPNKSIDLVFWLQKGEAFYELGKDQKTIISKSRLGFSLADSRALNGDFILKEFKVTTHHEKWEQPWGEQRLVDNHYNEFVVALQEFNPPSRNLIITFRIYDDGLAFRYEFPFQDELKTIAIADEQTEFNMSADCSAWWIPAYQPDRYEYLYKKTRLGEIDTVHTPLTIKTIDGRYVSIHEASLYEYGSMTIMRDGQKIKADITPLADGMKARLTTPFVMPWRTITVANRPADLAASRMMLNLNEPSKIEDTSWIKPTKFMGIWWGMFTGVFTWSSGARHGATTENAKQYIDYCVRLGIPALLIEGWNTGWDGNWMENGASFNFTEAYPDFNLEEVCAYAREKGIELIGHHETAGDVENYERQQPAAFELYHKLGIKYVKLGYVGSRMNHKEFHHSQYGVRHYQRMVELAAQYQIMLDIHEPIKGTGIERTWPNVMTREGARGQEYEGGGLTPEHTTVLPYTRGLAGPFDFTPGIFDLANYTKRVGTTLAKQLAFYVTIYSPMQMVSDRPEEYMNHAAFQFIRDVPVDWEQSIPMDGVIGEYYVIARQDRNSKDWYVGAVTNEAARTVQVSLDFLDSDCEYEMQLYADGEGAHWRDNPLALDVATETVTSRTTLTLQLAEGGGCAARFVPIKA